MNQTVQTPVSYWSHLKHGTIRDFVLDRLNALTSNNLEQRQAAVTEYHGLVSQLVMDPESGFCRESRAMLPIPKMSSRHIQKFFVSMQIWETELITLSERETFISAVFVWE